MPMKFKDFKQTQLFQQMDICQYYDANKNPLADKQLKRIWNKEVLSWFLKPTPPLNTLVIIIDI